MVKEKFPYLLDKIDEPICEELSGWMMILRIGI
jgi:hypothetical protein